MPVENLTINQKDVVINAGSLATINGFNSKVSTPDIGLHPSLSGKYLSKDEDVVLSVYFSSGITTISEEYPGSESNDLKNQIWFLDETHRGRLKWMVRPGIKTSELADLENALKREYDYMNSNPKIIRIGKKFCRSSVDQITYNVSRNFRRYPKRYDSIFFPDQYPIYRQKDIKVDSSAELSRGDHWWESQQNRLKEMLLNLH